MTEDVRKLLGGYATGTLTEDEKQALFEAAINDDELFAALSDEQALKEMLDDSAIRAQILRATDEPKFTIAGSLREWFERPRSKALVATGAVLLCVIAFNTVRDKYERQPEMAVLNSAPPAPTTALRDEPVAAPPATSPSKSAPKRQAKSEAAPPEKKVTVPAPVPAAGPPPPASAKSEEAEVVAQVPVLTRAPAPASASAQPARLRDASSDAATFEKAAGTGQTPIRWELLRKEADGEFHPVPANYEFATGDMIRVRVNVTQPGVVGINFAGGTGVTGPVSANQPAEIPPDGAIVIAAETQRLVLAFSPATALSTNNAFARGEMAKAKESRATAPTVEILLRRKKQ